MYCIVLQWLTILQHTLQASYKSAAGCFVKHSFQAVALKYSKKLISDTVDPRYSELVYQ